MIWIPPSWLFDVYTSLPSTCGKKNTKVLIFFFYQAKRRIMIMIKIILFCWIPDCLIFNSGYVGMYHDSKQGFWGYITRSHIAAAMCRSMALLKAAWKLEQQFSAQFNFTWIHPLKASSLWPPMEPTGLIRCSCCATLADNRWCCHQASGVGGCGSMRLHTDRRAR